ncbi:MAG: hypothetical protein JW810_07100 [Sedimentisphaerales bacterium]|nr:hypothetical protein [Sedimentisphaerales bacterium]
MNDPALLSALLELAEQVGLEVRQVPLGGEGGGLCRLRGKNILFVDQSAVPAEQVARTAAALAGLDELEDRYLVPQVRRELEKYRPPGDS